MTHSLTTKSHLAWTEPAPERLELSSSRTRAELELSRFRPGPRPLPHLGLCLGDAPENDSPDQPERALSPLSPTLHGPSPRPSGWS